MATIAPAKEWAHASAAAAFPERRWDLAVLGILAYLVVEYGRIQALYPVLAPLQVGKIAVALMGLGYVVSRRPQFSVPLRPVVDVSVLVIVLTGLLSATFSKYPDNSFQTAVVMVQWAVIYTMVSRVITNRWRLRVFLIVWLLLNFKLAQFAVRIYHYNLNYVAHHDAAYLARNGVGVGGWGFFSDGADFGVAMCTVWPVAMALAFARQKNWTRLALLGMSATYLAAILYCGSRGAIVGAAGVTLFSWLKSPRKLISALMVLLILPGLIFFLPQASKQRLQSAYHWEEDGTASARVRLWKDGVQMYLDHPVLGVGPGNYPIVHDTEYGGSSWTRQWVQHSTWVQVFSELGTFGLVAMVLILVYFFRLNAATRRTLLRVDPDAVRSWEYYLSIGLDLAMIGFGISGSFVSVLWYPHLWVLLGLTVALRTCAEEVANAAAQASKRPTALESPVPVTVAG